MENNEQDAVKEWAKAYFKTFIDNAPVNLGVGDKMTFAIRYMDKDGNWGDLKEIVTVDKKEVYDKR